jgi:ferric-dicitrate binding protein FerR (iron transport regulator)
VKPPYEDLSRLLGGDLPDPEAQALRARIEAEPAVRGAFDALSATVEDVASLADEPAPPALDARVLGATKARSRTARAGWWSLGAGGLLAAAAAVALFLGPRVPQITVVDGEQLVDGRANILADDVPVEIDGKARVTVEPAVVTVAVLEGTARLTGPSGVPLVVGAGESHTIGESSTAPSVTGTLPTEPASRIAALEAEVHELRRRLEQSELQGAFARGQLTAQQGPPSEWPAEVGEAYRPAAFEQHLKTALADLPGAEIHALDCSEYPCIVTLRITDTSPGWEARVEAFVDELGTEHYPNSDTWMAIAKSDDEGHVVGGVGLAFSPEYSLTEDMRTRTHYRAGSLLQEIEFGPAKP